jgi:ABC-type lipoprotein export system ATPase subunit
MKEYIVELNAVRHEYAAHGSARRVTVLRDAHLTIPYGTTVAIRGESGSGKTTLLNIIGGLERATSGQVIVDGSDLQAATDFDLTRFRAERVGFVFQDFNLLPDLTAQENVALPMDAFPALSSSVRKSRAFELLEEVGLQHRSSHDPQHLSGGERQRVAIARALANHPRLLLADEPTGNLGGRAANRVLGLLRDLNQKFGTTLITVTHDRRVALQCERIYGLRGGSLKRMLHEEREAAALHQQVTRPEGVMPLAPQPA